MWTWVPGGNPNVNGGMQMKLNSAHVVVHVKDAYGNDLPDYEVVYLLENIDEWLAGSQNAVDTLIPFAYLTDIDQQNDADGLPLVDSLDTIFPNYDQNGGRPDSDEPSPTSDPAGGIVGPGFNWNMMLADVNGYKLADHAAFFFNQWLGSDSPFWGFDTTDPLYTFYTSGQPGLPNWWKRITNAPNPVEWSWFGGSIFYAYEDFADSAWYGYEWPSTFSSADAMFDGFDGYAGDGYYPLLTDTAPPVGLATDGAKAWTLDGYFDASALWGVNSIEPNLLTGSNIDIQLAEGDNREADHYKSILRVEVYAPGDGLTKDGSYIWSTQVHQVWEVPEATTISISPTTDYAVAGKETESVTVSVKDQFGNPYPGETVYLNTGILEGTVLGIAPNTAVTTDSNGLAVYSLTQAAGSWGVETVTATFDTWTLPPAPSPSATSIIQWIYDDTQANPIVIGSGTPAYPRGANGYLMATNGQQKVVVSAGLNFWDGRTLQVFLNPGGNVAGILGSGLYDHTNPVDISTNLHTWVGSGTASAPTGEAYFVHAVSTDIDGVPNWMYDKASS